MATVELRPGDTLNIVWSSLQETPLGTQQVDANFAFSYEELLGRLQSKSNASKSRRSGSDGARFSRMVALSINALRKGTWSTGASIDREEIFISLLRRFQDLHDSEYKNITAHAKEALHDVCHSVDSYLTQDQRAHLKVLVDRLQMPKRKDVDHGS